MARLAALNAWLAALLCAIHTGELAAHPPTAALLALHHPLVVQMQASARGLVARRRLAARRLPRRRDREP